MCSGSTWTTCLSFPTNVSSTRSAKLRFLNQLIGLVSTASRGRQQHCPASRGHARIELEMLEGRALMSGIPGVSLSYGSLTIQAPAGSSGNVAAVSIDSSNGRVKVSLNGQSEEFRASAVGTITYVGGAGGGDTFVDDTCAAFNGIWPRWR